MAIDSAQVTNALIYGTVATTIVSLLSLSGVAIVPLVSGKSRQRWMHFFVAMAIATMSSDALLHIMPQLVGGHGHSHGGSIEEHHHHDHSTPAASTNATITPHVHAPGDDHDHDHHDRHKRHTGEEGHHHHDHEHDSKGFFELNDSRTAMLRLSTVLAAVYFIYLIEFMFYYRSRQRDIPPEKLGQCPAHDDHHSERRDSGPSERSSFRYSAVAVDDEAEVLRQKSSKSSLVSQSQTSQSDEEQPPTPIAGNVPVVFCGLKSRAIVILLGDAVHNLVDGVAIGTSFLSKNTSLGIVSTIAVICHELPHEIGDLAVLLDSGLSMPKALFMNLLSALTAFIGLYLSIAIGSLSIRFDIESINIYLLAITAGMFLYVAWVEMLPHLKMDGVPDDHWLLTLTLQSIGFFTGFLLIFTLGWMEEDIFG